MCANHNTRAAATRDHANVPCICNCGCTKSADSKELICKDCKNCP
jgi:hypothetical protein